MKQGKGTLPLLLKLMLLLLSSHRKSFPARILKSHTINASIPTRYTLIQTKPKNAHAYEALWNKGGTPQEEEEKTPCNAGSPSKGSALIQTYPQIKPREKLNKKMLLRRRDLPQLPPSWRRTP